MGSTPIDGSKIIPIDKDIKQRYGVLMSLLSQIKADQIQARKDRDKALASCLTTLLSEAANIGLNDGKRETSDLEVIAVAKKFIKNLDEVIANVGEAAAIIFEFEKDVYAKYLPQQMTEAEITEVAQGVIATIDEPSMKSLGLVMKELNQKHAGKFDGKTASSVVRQLLS